MQLLQVEHQPVRPARTKKLAVASSSSSSPPQQRPSTEVIDSILTEMEREILHTGLAGVDQSQVMSGGLADDQQPRIGGLTIQEFIHFLALLERVKEQHQASLPTLTDVVQDESRRHSLYDNMQQQQPLPGYRNASTSPRTSPPDYVDEINGLNSSSRSSSASSSSESSSSLSMEENEFHPSNNLAASAGFSMLERLFLRRYLHVIPEEAGSDCGSTSARISRALSGISSALSFLEEEDRRSSIIYSGDEDEEPDYCEPDHDPVTPVPTTVEEQESVYLTVVDEPPSTDSEYLTVVALPAIIIDCGSSEDEDLPNCSDLPSVLEDFGASEASIDAVGQEEEEEDDECQSLDESLLPLSVVQIQETVQTKNKPETDDAKATTKSIEDAAGTSVVTLIDTKIVSVDYQPSLPPISCTAHIQPRVPPTPSTETQEHPPPQPPTPAAVDETLDRRLETFQTLPDANSPLALERRQLDENQEKEEESRNAPIEVVQSPLPLVESESNPEAFFTPSPEPIQVAPPGQVDELRRFWEQRSVIGVGLPPPTRERVDSIEAFRMFFASTGWPPPPPPPPPPERYDTTWRSTAVGFSSETETGYSTDGSEKPFTRRRRLIPPPRPTPPREDLFLYYEPSFHAPPPHLQQQRMRHESTPRSQDGGGLGDDEDEVVKARLLADWLSVAKRSKSTSSIPHLGSSNYGRSNYSTMTSSVSRSDGPTTTNEDESTLCGDTSECDSDDWDSSRVQYRFRRIPSPPPRTAGYQLQHQGESSSMMDETVCLISFKVLMRGRMKQTDNASTKSPPS